MRNILESEVAGSIINVIIAENIRETKAKLESSVEKGLRLPASVDIIADMLVGGVAVVILNWFNNGKPFPKEKLLKEITAIIELGEKKHD